MLIQTTLVSSIPDGCAGVLNETDTLRSSFLTTGCPLTSQFARRSDRTRIGSWQTCSNVGSITFMPRGTSADVITYRIVGVYSAKTDVVAGSSDVGYADVTDRVVIDLTWKLSEMKL